MELLEVVDTFYWELYPFLEYCHGRKYCQLVPWALSPLQEMESMLSHFQSTLTNISAEIQTLQGQSLSINTKLKNRQAVRRDLHEFVDNIMVQDHLVL